MGKYQGYDTGLPLFSKKIIEVTLDGLFEDQRQQQAKLDLEHFKDEFSDFEEIAKIYLDFGVDGIVNYFEKANGNKEAAIEFAEKLRIFCFENKIRFVPVISPKIKSLIADAQIERQRKRENGPSFQLGKAIFNDRWNRLLR
jgi:hypothetical protein